MELYRITDFDPEAIKPPKKRVRIGTKGRAWAIKRAVDDINRGRRVLNADPRWGAERQRGMVTLTVEHVTVPDNWEDVTESFKGEN